VPTHQPASIEGIIEGFSPTSVGPSAAAFARTVVAQARPSGRARAKDLLFAAAKLGDFAVSVGLEATTETLFDDALVERFILCGTEGHSAGTRRSSGGRRQKRSRRTTPASPS
jgi:hypothetical protein